MVKIQNLEKSFQNNGKIKVVFSDFNLSIDKGEIIGLFGPNGSGKTTLLSILSGVDTDFYGQKKLNSNRIAYLRQDPNATLAPWFTCEKNILIAREFHSLDAGNGKVLLNRLSNEFHINFSLQQYPFSLSGGQRQIVTLIRSLIIEPDILLLDEPFSALDIDKRRDAMATLANHFTRGMTVVLCSHRGDEVKSLINRAITIDGVPAEIEKDLSAKDFASRELFEDVVSKINFKKHESKI